MANVSAKHIAKVTDVIQESNQPAFFLINANLTVFISPVKHALIYPLNFLFEIYYYAMSRNKGQQSVALVEINLHHKCLSL